MAGAGQRATGVILSIAGGLLVMLAWSWRAGGALASIQAAVVGPLSIALGLGLLVHGERIPRYGMNWLTRAYGLAGALAGGVYLWLIGRYAGGGSGSGRWLLVMLVTVIWLVPMPAADQARPSALASRLAGLLDGTVKPCRMSFGPWTSARDVVEATHAGMRVEAYVFDPWLEVWIQNFRLRAPGEVAFSVNEPNRVLSLMEPVSGGGVPDGLAVFRRPWEPDEGPVRTVFADADNQRAVRDLQLGPGESLTILSQQITARLRAGDDARLQARFEALGRLFRTNTRTAEEPAVTLEPRWLALGEPGEDVAAAPHRFGGSVEGNPRCRNCERPLHQLLRLDTASAPLDAALKELPPLPIATCLNCQALSSPLVLAHDGSGWAVREQAAADTFDDFPEALPERPVRAEASGPARRESKRGHRLGGRPDWLQSDETPDCPGCDEPMAFLAQLETDDRLGVQFGDDGRLYGFVCPRCVMVAAVMQAT